MTVVVTCHEDNLTRKNGDFDLHKWRFNQHREYIYIYHDLSESTNMVKFWQYGAIRHGV
jgi:hypothetical protein